MLSVVFGHVGSECQLELLDTGVPGIRARYGVTGKGHRCRDPEGGLVGVVVDREKGSDAVVVDVAPPKARADDVAADADHIADAERADGFHALEVGGVGCPREVDLSYCLCTDPASL